MICLHVYIYYQSTMQGGGKSDVREQLDSINARLGSSSVFVQFEEFQVVEMNIEAEAPENVAGLLRRYEGLAFEYLRKLIVYANVPQRNQHTQQSFSYFLEESIKITNTKFFPFFNTLLELNFIDFLSRLQKDVKDKGQRALQSRFDDLIRDNELCTRSCVGCNRFYYQYFPLEMNVSKRSYELIFLRSTTQEMISTAFAKPEKVEANNGLAIDLLHLEDSIVLLKQIVIVLNNNGGFIVVGCKKIQDFLVIKQQLRPDRLLSKFMNAQFVIGESLDEKRRKRISEGLHKLTRKITPFCQAQKSISLSFVPINPSLFELGFELETLKFDQQVFQKKQMHLVVIKIDPTLPHYDFRLNEDRDLQFEQYDTDYDIQNLQKQADIAAYLNQMREGMTQQEEQQEAFCMKPQVSYFQTHQDCRFQSFSA